MTVESGSGWEIRLGDFRETLSGVTCDAVIADPPYLGASASTGGGAWVPSPKRRSVDESPMGYAPASEDLLRKLCDFASGASGCWVVTFNDFVGTTLIQRELRARKLVVAEPIAWVKPPALTPPRGINWLPEKGTEFITCARTKKRKALGAILPGAYVSPRNTPGPRQSLCVTGGKPLPLMLDIVKDYSEPSDLVCDPFVGGGTTALACLMSGRRFIGSELSEENFRIAVNRLRKWESEQ